MVPWSYVICHIEGGGHLSYTTVILNYGVAMYIVFVQNDMMSGFKQPYLWNGTSYLKKKKKKKKGVNLKLSKCSFRKHQNPYFGFDPNAPLLIWRVTYVIHVCYTGEWLDATI